MITITFIMSFILYRFIMSKISHTLNLDKEIKQCAITKPYDALKSDFGKKLIEHLASDSNIREIVHKLDDETEVLTPKE